MELNLKKIKELKDKIDLRIFLKEVDSSFMVDNHQCYISGRTGKPTLVWGDRYMEFDTKELLENYIKSGPLRKVMEKVNTDQALNVDYNLSNRLLLDGINGLYDIRVLMDGLKEQIYQTKLQEIDFRVKFEMWSSVDGRIESGVKIENNESIPIELENTLRELAKYIPENEIWFGVVLVENAKEVLTTHKLEASNLTFEIKKNGFLKRGLLKDNDFAISFYAKSTAPFNKLEYNLDLNSLKDEPKNTIILKTIIEEGVTKDFVLDALKFDTFRKDLVSSSGFDLIVKNPVFRYFFFDYLKGKLAAKSFEKEMLSFIESSLNQFETLTSIDPQLLSFKENLDEIKTLIGVNSDLISSIMNFAEFNKKFCVKNFEFLVQD